VDQVEERGGGTLFIAGSHRLIDDLRRQEGPGWEGRSSDVRKVLLARLPWLRELSSQRPGEDRRARFMDQPAPSEGTSLQVVELMGNPGDVFAMHPWILHNAAPNCGVRPRMVLTARVRSPCRH
jgi:hypothetical protein